MNTHIPTLLLREWMQHKRGWLIAAFAPPLIAIALALFANPHVEGSPRLPLEMIALMMTVLSGCVVYVICLLVALFQLPGLARRDSQDRSIEFWLSLPGRPSESVAATVLAHAWLAPVGGALVGALFGLPFALMALGSKLGWGTAFSLPWGEIISAAAPMLARGLAGTVLLTLWLAPLILVLMAASSWLKRLGVPVVLVGSAVAATVMHKAYGIDWPLDVLMDWSQRINHTLVYDERGLMNALQSEATSLWPQMAHDLGQALADLASLQFLGWTALSAAAFALVVMKRARGGS
ncbi:MAG TPA: hypothetical protein VIN03_21890 [Roseateles sp.]